MLCFDFCIYIFLQGFNSILFTSMPVSYFLLPGYTSLTTYITAEQTKSWCLQKLNSNSLVWSLRFISLLMQYILHCTWVNHIPTLWLCKAVLPREINLSNWDKGSGSWDQSAITLHPESKRDFINEKQKLLLLYAVPAVMLDVSQELLRYGRYFLKNLFKLVSIISI